MRELLIFLIKPLLKLIFEFLPLAIFLHLIPYKEFFYSHNFYRKFHFDSTNSFLLLQLIIHSLTGLIFDFPYIFLDSLIITLRTLKQENLALRLHVFIHINSHANISCVIFRYLNQGLLERFFLLWV